MEYKVTNEQLLKVFTTVMEPYSNLDEGERSYDFWVQEKNRYVDLDVFNYYENIEEGWEDDSWILQVQYDKGDAGENLELPILRYSEWDFRTISIMFGDYFEPLLKDWFNTVYPFAKRPINSVTKEQD
jgi:hypothetical protein